MVERTLNLFKLLAPRQTRHMQERSDKEIKSNLTKTTNSRTQK